MTRQLFTEQKKMSSTIIIFILVIIVKALVITCLYYVRLTNMLRIGNEALLMQVKELTEENKLMKEVVKSQWTAISTIPKQTKK